MAASAPETFARAITRSRVATNIEPNEALL
jgi:hypothetical protein